MQGHNEYFALLHCLQISNLENQMLELWTIQFSIIQIFVDFFQ